MSQHLPPTNRTKPHVVIGFENASVEEFLIEATPNILRFLTKYGLSDYKNDIVQDVLIVILKEQKKNPIRDLKAFFFYALMIKIKEYCRDRNRENDVISYFDNAQIEFQKAAKDDPFLQQELEEAYQAKLDRLYRLMDIHLPFHQKRAIQLRYLENKSYKEISQIVGRSEDSVRQDVSRGQRKLRMLM